MNRRNFLTLGAAAVALPLLSNTAGAETIKEDTDTFFIGMYDSEALEGFDLLETEWSYFFTAQQFADDPKPRIVSCSYRLIPNQKIIQVNYLEPTSEKFPELDYEGGD